MKHLTKKIMKIAMCVMVAVMLIVPSTALADGGTFGISASSSTVAPNGTFTVSIGGQCSGRVDISVDNGTASVSKAWMDVGVPASVTVTAGESGNVTVTAIPYDGLSDPDAMEFAPGNKSVTVTIVQPEPEEPDTPDEPDDSNKNDTPSSSDKDNKPSSKPSSSDKDTEVDEQVEDEPVEDEPVVDEPVVDEPVVDEPVIDEPVVEEPVEKGCFIHWIILIIMVIAAILTFVFKKNMMIDIAILAVAAIISVILSALVGACVVDWIITVIGVVVLAIMSMMLSRQTKTSEK